MELNLKKPIVFFDLETTGLNIAKCNRPYTHSNVIKVKEEGFILRQYNYTLMCSQLGTIEEFNAWLASEHPTLEFNM